LPIRNPTKGSATGRLPVGDWLACSRSFGPAGLALAALAPSAAPLPKRRKSAGCQPAPAARGAHVAGAPPRCAPPGQRLSPWGERVGEAWAGSGGVALHSGEDRGASARR